jgi:hypothetical protein
MSPTHWAVTKTRGDGFAGLMLDAVDLPQVKADAKLGNTDASNLLFATCSQYYANRADIRKWLIGRILPGFEALGERLRPPPARPFREQELAERALPRLRETAQLCRAHGARLIVVIPPTNSNSEGAAVVARLGREAGVDVLVPVHDEALTANDYRDGFHLNGRGRAIFTGARATQLKQVLWQGGGASQSDGDKGRRPPYARAAVERG